MSQWVGTTQWLRNRVVLAAGTETLDLIVRRTIRDGIGEASTTRGDDAGLREVVAGAERMQGYVPESPRELIDPVIAESILQPTLWSESTYAMTGGERSELARRMAAPVEAAGLFSAGTLRLAGEGHATMSTDGTFRYYPVTAAECAMTVRDAAGTASGWAGVTHYDLAKIDPIAIAARALEKCQRSRNPRALEPGRYTVILEPQAVHDLVAPLIDRAMIRGEAESGFHPFAGGSAESASKIGSQVIDRRLMLRADPMDPEAGFLPFDEMSGIPYRPVTWIDRGVLSELAYDRRYAVARLGETTALLNSRSFHLRAAPDVSERSLESMIAATRRGLLVTRFSDVQLVDFPSLLCSGFTRDGLWLIQDGQITMPVKNFRFTDSPLFALNSVEAVGPAARVFSPGRARITPALMVRDFNFTSLADAV